MKDDATLLKEFGENLRKIREAKGLSQEVVGDSLGSDGSHIGKIERGEKRITILTVMKLLSALKCEANELFPK